MKHLHQLLFALVLLSGLTATAQTEYKFNDKQNGFSVNSKSGTTLTIGHNVNAITIENAHRDGLAGQYITLSGIHIDNEAGAPNLPSSSTFIAIPNDAEPSIQWVSSKTRVIENVDLIPAPQPQLDDDDSPAVYQKDMNIYGRNAWYPATPYHISEVMTVRGVAMVQVGVMPFQYNPVTKELLVYEDIELQLSCEGGDGTYGDNRYRTPEWDHILSDLILNRDALPEVDYGEKLRKHYENRETGCEYIIITPDNDDFVQLADSIRLFRILQGIPTEIFTVTECGGNDEQAIRNFIRNAYNTWDMPPAAVLILGDHSSDPTKGVVSFVMNNHPGGGEYNPYISDHAYSVMGNNHMPDIILGRITGRNYNELYHMIKKDLDYERTPPTNPDFYDHPVTAMGFQLERWFQLCSEVVNGFWEFELGKHPVRINAVYQGTPGSQWSSHEGTNTIVNYFGPTGCGYIPQTMSHLTDWNGSGSDINDAINSGAFLVQHRDHGAEELWGEPGYSIDYILNLTNPDLTYVMSNNCLTGRFNYNGANGCFAEAFHRHQHGALGLVAATQVSYSFVNDVYVWGAYDNMWPDFMPTYGTVHENNFVLPAFGNAAGKYFLQQSYWASSTYKEITYYLFHQHGDAYMNLYTEMPQHLEVEMLPVLVAGSDHYQIKVEEGATICLTVNDQIIGFANSTGDIQEITVTPQTPGTRVLLTIKKQNYYRYEHELATIPNDEPYLIINAIQVNDNEEGNGNQALDYDETCHLNVSLHNVGFTTINDVNTTLSCPNPEVEILESEALYSVINADETLMVDNAFKIRLSNAFYDGDPIRLFIQMNNESLSFIDSIDMLVNAPVLRYTNVSLATPEGEATDRLYAGETTLITFDLTNQGHSKAFDITNALDIKAPFLDITENQQMVPELEAGETTQVTFQIEMHENAPEEHILDYTIDAETSFHTANLESSIFLGYTIEDFEDDELTPNVEWRLGSGNKAWHIIEDETALGGHCLSSPPLADNKNSSLYMLILSNGNDKFSFYHKTSTEPGDKMTLLVNNQQLYEWSGETDWEQTEVELTSERTIVRFIFSKDGQNSGGNDCVMLDHFIMPPVNRLIIFAGDDAEGYGDEPFTPNSYAYHHKEILWSTSGDGTFDDATAEKPTYHFGVNDIENGQVTLTMTGVSNQTEPDQHSQVNIAILGPTDVAETDGQPFSIYPNPTQGQIRIHADNLQGEQVFIQIYDGMGRLVKEATASVTGHTLECHINLSGLSQGLYHVQLIDNGSTHHATIVAF